MAKAHPATLMADKRHKAENNDDRELPSWLCLSVPLSLKLSASADS